MPEDHFSHQDRFGVFSGIVASQVCGFWRVPGQGLLYAPLVLWTAPDIAVVRVFGSHLFLPVHS